MGSSDENVIGTAPDESFSAVFRRIFRSSGFTSQVALAKAMGVTQSLISRYLGGKGARLPTPEHIRMIAELCGHSVETRKRYEQVMLQVRAHQEFPGIIPFGDSLRLLPPDRFTSEFRARVREDLTRWPRRRWRGMVEEQGLTWRMVQRMLDGRGVLSVDQVHALARALHTNAEVYLFLVGMPSHRFYRVMAGQQKLLGDLLALPKASRKDVQAVLRESSRQGVGHATRSQPSSPRGSSLTSEPKRLRRNR